MDSDGRLAQVNAQVMEALRSGQDKRLEYADRRRTIKALGYEAGRSEVVATLRDPDEVALRMKARYLIESIDRFGDMRVGRLIRKTQFGYGRLGLPLGELTERERQLLADHLENPDLPAAPGPLYLDDDERELLRFVCTAVASKTSFGKQRNQLWQIAAKLGVEQVA